MNDYAIRTERLTRDFRTVRAVDALNIEVPPGIVFGFLGPNGSGKTTTIRLLLGLLQPSHGQAQVLGCDTRTQADQIRRQSGALLEHHGLYERLSAEENLEFAGRVCQMPSAERKARIAELLKSLELYERRKEVVMEWSRGMKQKLSVARTLLHRPRLVFLDEPTAGLDPVAAAALRTDLARLAETEGVTVFLTTHNLAEADVLCRQVGVIRQGRLLAVGSPEALRRSGRPPRLTVQGSGFTEAMLNALRQQTGVHSATLVNNHLEIDLATGMESMSAAPLVKLLVEMGVVIEEVRREQASLEEVFLTLMEEEK